MRVSMIAAMGGAFLSSLAFAAGSPADLSAQWLTEGGKSRVEIGACETAPAQLCGKIVWLREPTNPDGSAGEPQTIAEYFGVSEEKLNALPHDKFIELRDNGALAQIYAHLVSLAGWDRLIALAMARAPQVPAPANA